MGSRSTIFNLIVSYLFLGIGILSDLVVTYESNDVSKRIVCYYQSYTSMYKYPFNYDTKDIPLNLCTDIVYLYLDYDYETQEFNVPDSRLRRFTSVGTGSSTSGPNLFLRVDLVLDIDKWSAMVVSAAHRSSFVSGAVRQLKKYGFNGVDLSWRHPNAEDREHYVNLVEEFVNALKPSGRLLTISLSLIDIVLRPNNFNIQRLSELVHWINVMTTALRTHWDKFVDVPSPLYRREFDKQPFLHSNVHDGLEIMERLGAPRNKLMVGIAFYGESYTLEKSSDVYLTAPVNQSAPAGNAGPIMNITGELAYFEICRLVSTGKWTRRFDNVGKCPYAYHGDQWVGYEDEESIGIKMNYIKNNGYGGAMVDSINMDDFNGFCGSRHSLLFTIHQALSTKIEQKCEGSELVLNKRYEAMGIIPTCAM